MHFHLLVVLFLRLQALLFLLDQSCSLPILEGPRQEEDGRHERLYAAVLAARRAVLAAGDERVRRIDVVGLVEWHPALVPGVKRDEHEHREADAVDDEHQETRRKDGEIGTSRPRVGKGTHDVGMLVHVQLRLDAPGAVPCFQRACNDAHVHG